MVMMYYILTNEYCKCNRAYSSSTRELVLGLLSGDKDYGHVDSDDPNILGIDDLLEEKN